MSDSTSTCQSDLEHVISSKTGKAVALNRFHDYGEVDYGKSPYKETKLWMYILLKIYQKEHIKNCLGHKLFVVLVSSVHPGWEPTASCHKSMVPMFPLGPDPTARRSSRRVTLVRQGQRTALAGTGALLIPSGSESGRFCAGEAAGPRPQPPCSFRLIQSYPIVMAVILEHVHRTLQFGEHLHNCHLT